MSKLNKPWPFSGTVVFLVDGEGVFITWYLNLLHSPQEFRNTVEILDAAGPSGTLGEGP